MRKGGNGLPFISTLHRKEVKQWKHLLSDKPLKHSSIAFQRKSSSECDKYESDYTVFNVLGIEVWIENDKLSEALKALTEKKRNIILLSYFMDMADGEISHFINIPRSNVQYHRTKTLETLRKYMEEHK